MPWRQIFIHACQKSENTKKDSAPGIWIKRHPLPHHKLHLLNRSQDSKDVFIPDNVAIIYCQSIRHATLQSLESWWQDYQTFPTVVFSHLNSPNKTQVDLYWSQSKRIVYVSSSGTALSVNQFELWQRVRKQGGTASDLFRWSAAGNSTPLTS